MEINANSFLSVIGIAAILIAGFLVINNAGDSIIDFNLPSFLSSNESLAQKAIDYVNANDLAGEQATLGSVSTESGLIRFEIKLSSGVFVSYITKDGKMFFPRAGIDLTASATPDISTAVPTVKKPEELVKVDSPSIESYIVSQCPYGLQIQRAMAEAVKALPAIADYVKIRYIGSVADDKIYAMHDRDAAGNPAPNGKEGMENLLQICLREEQPKKYWPYVSCYMQKGDTKGCLSSQGIDMAKLNSCVDTPGKGLAYAQVDFDLGLKILKTDNIASPTNVFGSVKVDESGFGGRSADAIRSMVCAASKTEPKFCSQKLTTEQAASSYSSTYK